MTRATITTAALLLALLLGNVTAAAKAPDSAAEPNTQVPAGNRHYAATGFPDRMVASPAQDAARGFGVSWRTDASVSAPTLEWVAAGDSPDVGTPTRITAATRALETENGTAHYHRADVAGLQPDTLYLWRVQGNSTWSAWHQLRTAGTARQPLTLLYFGDTQNKNLSHVSRVLRAGIKAAPDARLSLFAGDLVSGGDGQDDSEWGEWFAAAGWLPQETAVAPAIGNHEYFEEFEDTPQERRVLGRHWPMTFALPRNGVNAADTSTYWFDYQGVRIAVLDGTSALDLGTAQAQAAWLDTVLANNPHPWSIVLLHQPFYSPREGRENAELRDVLLPVVRRHQVDLVLQGHDHTYGRRGE
ncbi:MAG: metallophosphoesterase family protein, partial [Stenotrophomonas sp.]